MKLKKLIRNDRGDMTIGAVFLILVLNMLIAFLLLFVSIQIQSANIRSSVEIELNNLSAVIAQDTYKATREGNLTEYAQICNTSQYYTYLQQIFQTSLAKHLKMDTEMYNIQQQSIDIYKNGDKIQFEYRATVKFNIYMFGTHYPTISKDIVLTGSYNTKF